MSEHSMFLAVGSVVVLICAVIIYGIITGADEEFWKEHDE